MPEQKTVKRAQADKRAGKHGMRSAKQAIAIGLSEARRAGVALKVPKKSTESTSKRARASENALKRESTAGASRTAMSKQTKTEAAKRPAASRSAAAKKLWRPRVPPARSAAAKKAAQTRAARAP
ncbi:MAG: Histone H1 [uncultured Paraburkholderia sp.]|nr:MAG: Histone H1 [uncultured Paraburkholderia sp.]CAH2916055.1 MAG: Histone H1 [uncultured Paraburkholderia sp.]